MTNSAQPKTRTLNLRPATAALAIAIAFCVAVTTQPAHAQTYQVLYNFTGQADGGDPAGGLVMDQRGDLYGMTSYYGRGSCSFGGDVGCGTAFELARKGSGWIFNLLYTFTGGNDGETPTGRMVFGPDGSLYGTTAFGGGGNCTFGQGCGTVFNLKPPATACKSALCPWTETILYHFTGGNDGMWPQLGDLTFDQSGNIYGTTPPNVYELVRSNGSYTFNLVFKFTNNDGGCCSFSNTLFDQAGNIYGTTYAGGNGSGVVFQLMPGGGGWTYNQVHAFQGQTDGAEPEGNLIFDQQGNIYGTTPQGGAYNAGTVYEVTPSSGAFSVLHTFYGTADEGPTDAVIFDAQGNLYGTTYGGGSHSRGNIFKLTPYNGGWMYQSIYDFTGGSDGGAPTGPLILDPNGNIYGTTFYGGTGHCSSAGCGVVFEITP